MFTNMRMNNFKSWVDTGDISLAPITGFFGTNSSGKSSLLQMLLLLKQTTESTDRELVLKTGNIQEGYVNLGTVQEITHKDSTDLTLSIAWDFPGDELNSKGLSYIDLEIPDGGRDEKYAISHLNFSTHIFADQQRIYVKELSYSDDDSFSVQMYRAGNNQYTITIELDGRVPNRPQGRPRVYMKPQKCYGFSDEALRFYQDTDYLSDIVLSFEQQFQRLYYLGPLREYPKRIYTWGGERPADVGLKGELAVPTLLAGNKDRVYSNKKGKGARVNIEQRVAQWLVDLGLAASFQTEPLVQGGIQYEVRLQRNRDGQQILITDMGFGVSQVLPVLVLCYSAPEGSTLIFEQPELHLHPSVQSALADVFIDVAHNRNLQILVESHSEHLLRRLQRRIAEEKIQTKDVALYFCDFDRDQSTIEPLEIDMFGSIRNWPKDFFGDLAGEMVAAFDAEIDRKATKGGR